MTKSSKFLRKLILTTSFACIFITFAVFVYSVISLRNQFGFNIFQQLNSFGIGLSVPLIGVWIASQVQRIDLLTSPAQETLFKILAIISIIVLALNFLVDLTQIASGNLNALRVIFMKVLLISVLSLAIIWPAQFERSQDSEEIFE